MAYGTFNQRPNMKKQINPTIKAHLIRGAFYLILLVAVCAIPFALARRNTDQTATAKIKRNSVQMVINSGTPTAERLSY